jgi:hypothetical protein
MGTLLSNIWQGTPAYRGFHRDSREEASEEADHQEERLANILHKRRRLAEAESE